MKQMNDLNEWNETHMKEIIILQIMQKHHTIQHQGKISFANNTNDLSIEVNPPVRFGRARSPGKQEEESNALLSKGLVVMNESTGKFEMEGETTLEPMKILGNT